MGFNLVSEYLFWDEFGVRFNFISVDYLVYSHEVIGNIKESYPLYFIISLVALFSFVAIYFSKNSIKKVAK